jgi:hypothetical protein
VSFIHLHFLQNIPESVLPSDLSRPSFQLNRPADLHIFLECSNRTSVTLCKRTKHYLAKEASGRVVDYGREKLDLYLVLISTRFANWSIPF